MYRLIIAGGRDFTDERLCKNELHLFMDYMKIQPEELTVVSGTAKGADQTGEKVAAEHNIKVDRYPADWKDMSEPCVRKRNTYGEYNAMAGMKRNEQMRQVADGLLAFWDGQSRGTKDMIQRMRDAGKHVTVVRY